MTSDGRAHSRTFVVTGAASGIGLATARRLLDEGGTVVGTDVAAPPHGLGERFQFVAADITAIDPVARRVETSTGAHEGDVMVVALGADLDPLATPGLLEGGHEFYTDAGAFALRDVLDEFPGGRVVVGVCSTPFKCPPAPSEAALLVHDLLVRKGVRERSEVHLVMPLPVPIPPSPRNLAASAVWALLKSPAARVIASSSRSSWTLLPSRREARPAASVVCPPPASGPARCLALVRCRPPSRFSSASSNDTSRVR